MNIIINKNTVDLNTSLTVIFFYLFGQGEFAYDNQPVSKILSFVPCFPMHQSCFDTNQVWGLISFYRFKTS